jgi:hypothetical protein
MKNRRVGSWLIETLSTYGGALLGAFTAKQTTIQCSSCKKHLFDRRIDRRVRQNISLRGFDLKLRTAAHQFFDKRRADALRAPDNGFEEFIRNFQPSGVESG